EYVARLQLAPDAAWDLVNGGIPAGLNFSQFSGLFGQAESIATGSTVSGLITNSTPAQAFSFDATAGTTINVVADAQTGSLDTAIALYGPGNNVVATNEDASEETTDSAINATLTEDGTYVVIVSRYALSIGGT